MLRPKKVASPTECLWSITIPRWYHRWGRQNYKYNLSWLSGGHIYQGWVTAKEASDLLAMEIIIHNPPMGMKIRSLG